MKTPISYYGGKQKLAKEIINLIPHKYQYVEPFVGGGAVFFMKPDNGNEVINDLNGDITNFYMQMKINFNELQKLIQGTLHSEINYNKSKEILKSKEGTELERAWALWCQCNLTFSHIIYGGFAFGECRKSGLLTSNKRNDFTNKYMERLSKVEIMCRDAHELIKLKDTENTFFYCDPPYVSSECHHYKGYTIENFTNLLEILSNIKGKFLLSSYPEDVLLEYRKKYNWNIKDIKQVVSVTGKREETKYKTECITWNYNKEKTLFDI